MTKKIFGVGWAKTGTTTLGDCLRILGYNHESQRLDLVGELIKGNHQPLFDVVDQKESFEDWPWIILYEKLDKQYPDSYFVLTKRDPVKWLASYRNMLKLQGKADGSLNEIRSFLYGLDFPNVTDEQLLRRYQKHNRDIEEYFKDRPDALLVVDWSHGDGWQEICRFLNTDIPTTPFPHANKSKYLSHPIFKYIRKLLNKNQ